MSHIDGRRQRRLSKNKDYKKRYGCPAGPGMYHPHPSQAQAKRIDRRRLKRQLQPLRDFTCHGTLECACPACDNDELVTAFTTQPRALTCHCDCGGYSPLAAAVRRLAKTGNVGQVESFVGGVPGLDVYVEKEVRRADEQSTETKYTAHRATGHHLVTWTVEEPAKHNRCAQPKDDG